MIKLGRFRGVVFEYNVQKSLGFLTIISEQVGNLFVPIHPKKMDQVFIYHNEIEPDIKAFKKLQIDQKVEFDVYRRDRGLCARNLQFVSEEEDNINAAEMYAMRLNGEEGDTNGNC